MIANPAARFTRPKTHVSLIAKPYERRTVCIIPETQLRNGVRSCKCHTHFARSKVEAHIERGEMTYLDQYGDATGRKTNIAGYTEAAAATWQKTRSGPVCTMQMKVGEKGRRVPAWQVAPSLEELVEA